jgi:acyl-coenzyme A synthetase/AMP-(fatty) acid ligase
MDEDGFITVQGRLNDQISVDGMKCQPLEVENVLNLHPLVKESAVVGLPDADTYQCVGAAVAVEPGRDRRQLVESLQAHCRQKLEPVKVPKRILFLDAIPRTDLGKIKRTEILKLMTEAREA